jgi:hypothetical protein
MTLPIAFTKSEMQDVKDLASTNTSFMNNVIKKRIDYTAILKDELLNILYGKIPRNFIINIKSCIGSPTGVFKSSLGLQFAIELDPTFNVFERVAFTPNQLNDLIKKHAKRRQIFVLDEQVRDLKMSAETRLANIAESCRERQICIIMVGVAERFMTISHYHLERFGESDDDHLPKKTVYYILKKIVESKRVYRGYIHHDITPLTDVSWRTIWDDYMQLKSDHQDAAIKQEITGFNFEKKAKELASEKEFVEGCFNEDGKLLKGKLRNFIYKKLPDVTNEERRMVFYELSEDLEKYVKDVIKDIDTGKENVKESETESF